MKSYKAYNPVEINGIANKFTAGEFVTKVEMKVWYAYKNAVKYEISCCQDYLKMAEKNRGDKPKSEITLEIEQEQKMAQDELTWIRSIKTFPLEDFCRFYEADWNYNLYGEDRPSLILAKRVNEGASETEQMVIREIMEESDILQSINHYRDLTTPVNLRKWTLSYNRATEYCPFETACDDTRLYDGKEHYVYIKAECKQHRWGDTYWISTDCSNELKSLPVIKAFKEHDFQVGKFYKITCTDTIHFGNNKKKYIMEIEETDEQTFMTKGLKQYTKRW